MVAGLYQDALKDIFERPENITGVVASRLEEQLSVRIEDSEHTIQEPPESGGFLHRADGELTITGAKISKGIVSRQAVGSSLPAFEVKCDATVTVHIEGVTRLLHHYKIGKGIVQAVAPILDSDNDGVNAKFATTVVKCNGTIEYAARYNVLADKIREIGELGDPSTTILMKFETFRILDH